MVFDYLVAEAAVEFSTLLGALDGHIGHMQSHVRKANTSQDACSPVRVGTSLLRLRGSHVRRAPKHTGILNIPYSILATLLRLRGSYSLL